MIKKNTIIKNYLYNVIFKIFQLITPIITVPYIARVLGSDCIGKYAYTSAVLVYFGLFASLGMITYGNRSIAYVRDDFHERSRVFWELFIAKLIISLIVLCFYFTFIFTYGSNYKELYLIQTLGFLGIVFDISWFFAALEDFKKIVIRDMIIRIISIILIFTFVKTKADLNMYVFILSVGSFVSSLIICAYLKNKIVFKKIDFKKIFSHLKPLFILFIPFLAKNIYSFSDRILIGIYAGESETGYYEMALKIITLLSTATMTLGIVMYPRMSNLFAKQDYGAIKGYIGKSFNFLNFIAIPMVLGIIAIANDFIPWFLGEDFPKVPLIICISAVLIFLEGVGSSLNSQIMLPMGKEKILAIIACVGAVLSLGLNFLLIPHFQAIGAAISAIITAFVLRAVIIYILKDFLPFRAIFKEFEKYLFSGLLMFIAVYSLGVLMPSTILTTAIQVFTGGIIYIAATFVLRCEMNMFLLEKIMQVCGLEERFKNSNG